MKRRKRKLRVSCFAPGSTLSDAPLIHRAPRSEDKARERFLEDRKLILSGKCAFVVLHYGNLKHQSYEIVERCDSYTRADQLTEKCTSFSSFQELLEAPAYRPTLNVFVPERKELADLYDAAQKARKSTRRAHRIEWRPCFAATVKHVRKRGNL